MLATVVYLQYNTSLVSGKHLVEIAFTLIKFREKLDCNLKVGVFKIIFVDKPHIQFAFSKQHALCL